MKPCGRAHACKHETQSNPVQPAVARLEPLASVAKELEHPTQLVADVKAGPLKRLVHEQGALPEEPEVVE
eukprot:365861-Chlamydomonas_euryale.AAC.3